MNTEETHTTNDEPAGPLTVEQQIEAFAGLFYTRNEVSILTGVDPDDYCIDFERHYVRGWLRSDAEVRKSVLQLAKAGSTPAQNQVLKYLEGARIAAALEGSNI